MFTDRLNTLKDRVPGAVAVGLVAEDGISVESVGGGDLDLEVLAAETVAMARGIGSEQRALGLGVAERLEINTASHAVMLGQLEAGYYLLVVVDGATPMGRPRFEMRRAPLLFENELA